MVRLIMLLLFMALVAATAVALKSCGDAQDRAIDKIAPGADSGIVKLRDGATLLAEKGTVGRDLADWFAQPHAAPRTSNWAATSSRRDRPRPPSNRAGAYRG